MHPFKPYAVTSEVFVYKSVYKDALIVYTPIFEKENIR
jgi:hypothetical protein